MIILVPAAAILIALKLLSQLHFYLRFRFFT